MGKTALVVSGGGSKGAFAVGAIQHLVEDLGLTFDIVSGTSTGALIAPLVVTGEIGELVRLYTSMKTEDVVLRRRLSEILKTDSVFDVGPLAGQVKKLITDARVTTILRSHVQMFIATVCLQTERVTYFQSGPPGQVPAGCDLLPIDGASRLMRAMMGSADMPALMPPVEVVRGATPLRQYVDGGVRERAPLEVALLNGATDIYAVILAPKQHAPQEKRFEDVPGILMRTIDILTDDVLLHDLLVVESVAAGRRYLESVRGRVAGRFGLSEADVEALFADATAGPNALLGEEVNLHVIRPAGEFGIETLECDPVVMARLVGEGRNRAVAALASPREWLA